MPQRKFNIENVLMQSGSFFVNGQIKVLAALRLSDYIQKEKEFFNVVNATIYDNHGKELHRSKYVAVSRSHNSWVTPIEDIDFIDKTAHDMLNIHQMKSQLPSGSDDVSQDDKLHAMFERKEESGSSVSCVFFKNNFIYEGQIQFNQSVRLSDFLNAPHQQYFRVQNVMVKDIKNRTVLRSKFITINRSDIDLVAPSSSVV